MGSEIWRLYPFPKIKRATAKAYLIDFGKRKEWFPKSQTEIIKVGEIEVLAVPLWLAERKKTGGYPFLEIPLNPKEVKAKKMLERMLKRVWETKESHIATHKLSSALTMQTPICCSSDLKGEFGKAGDFITIEVV